MFKAVGKVALNLILIFAIEELVRETFRLIRGEWGRRPR